MTDCMCTTLALTAVLGGVIYFLFIRTYSYWKRRGVKQAKCYPIAGSFPGALMQKHHMADDIDKIYKEFRNTENFVGVFTARKPQLLILSPELAHKVYVNDFKCFHDNEFSDFVDIKVDPIFANNPFSIKGQKWKERRAEITPGLTPNRIKTAYPVTLKVLQRFKKYTGEQIQLGSADGVDVMDLALRYTCEVTTDCVLGIQANTLSNDPSPVLEMTKSIFDFSVKMVAYQLFVGFFPGLERFYKIRFFPKNAETFFIDLMQQSIKLRKTQHTDRADFLNYLLQLGEKKNFSDLELTAHSMTFLLDGFFTTASTIAHCLFLLAKNPEKQAKLREEISANMKLNGMVEYDQLHELPYLDACFYETLRVFSPLLFANKLCTAPYEMENKDGSKVKLEPGDVVIVPVNSIHLDENNYEQASEYIPERFLGSDVLKSYREKGMFFGFGDGPRACFGARFALTQAKAAIVETVGNYKLTVNPKTRSDNRLDPVQFIAMKDGGVFLNFEPLH